MANHLRELVDCAERNDVLTVAGSPVTLEKLRAARELVAHQSKNAVCFDAGEVNDYSGLSIIDELVRLPYPVCWVEMSRNLPGEGVVIVGVMAAEDEKGIFATVWLRGMGHWIYEFSLIHQRGEKNTDVIHINKSDSDSAQIAGHVVSVFRAFLSALNCTNVRRVEHKPDAKLQKARAKRGKQPLFSYWTLELTPGRAEDGQGLGGTHASPRLHLRRGHPRQYAPGKWTWVQPCVVGNKAAGIVHKDYAMVTQ